MIDLKNLTALQQKALELLKKSDLDDDSKKEWFNLTPFLPPERIQRMIEKLEEEQNIKKGILPLTPSEEKELARRFKEIEKEAFHRAEEESEDPKEVLESKMEEELNFLYENE